MRLSLAFLLRLAVLAVLSMAPAFARAPSTRPRVDETCPNLYRVLPNREERPAYAVFAPVEYEAPAEFKAIFAGYTDDATGKRRQVMDLLDMRLELEQKRKFSDAARKNKYEALEWKNLHEGLIQGDLDGKDFVAAVNKFRIASKEERLAGVDTFANTRHPKFQEILNTLVKEEEDPEVLRALRRVAAMRSIPIDYTLPKIEKQILEDSAKYRSGDFFERERSVLPEKILDKWLSSADVNAQIAAMSGLRGRPNHFLLKYVNWPNSSVQKYAIESLNIGSDAGDMRSILESYAIHSKDKWVRSAAITKLAQYADATAYKTLSKLQGSEADLSIRSTIDSLLGHLRESEIQAGRLEDSIYSGLPRRPDDILLKDFLSSDPSIAASGAQYLAHASLELKFAALQAPLAETRLAAARQITQWAPDATLNLGTILLQDKVADLRLLGIEYLGKQRNSPEVLNVIRRAAELDEDPEVRRQALALISVKGGRNGNVVYNQSREATYVHYLEKVKEQLGAPGVREHDIIPYAVADHIYLAPEADVGKTAEELVAIHKKFRDTAPVGYKILNPETDPATGFVGAIYQSADTVERPMIVGIGGTWTGADVMADVNLGVSQARSQAFQALLEDTVKAIAVTTNRNIPEIVIAGHSLGGGMAQVFGHELVALLESKGMMEAAAKVRVTSFNGFGGEEALKRIGRYDKRIVAKMRATSYYVPADPVSFLGNHLGESIKLPRIGMGNPTKVHQMAAVGQALLEKGGLVGDQGSKRSRKYVVPAISAVIGPVLDKISYLRYKVREKAIFEKLCDARIAWAAEEDYKHLKPEYDWLKGELERAAENMFGAGRRDKAKAMLQYVEKKRLEIIRERQVLEIAEAS
jgi:hypothetical protein